ncbi:MAG TPA: transposase [Phycisphaerae bacterium]|nr:transposase [Phycisphaerae bacterium]
MEPNSAPRQAITYLPKHWQKLTVFARQPGALLDNDVVERTLKRAILHRKNALFYRTLHGAHVGDLFMSLIHTCQSDEIDPFDCLTELRHRAVELAAQPEHRIPRNYPNALSGQHLTPQPCWNSPCAAPSPAVATGLPKEHASLDARVGHFIVERPLRP